MFIKKIGRFFINLFKLIIETIITMKTWRGLLSLFLSFMIFAGWAYVFIGIGMIFNSPYLVAVGTAVALFWIGPFTPLIPIVIIVAFLIQRHILRDRSNDAALKQAIRNFKERGFKSEEELPRAYHNKIKYSHRHQYKNLYKKLALRSKYVYK